MLAPLLALALARIDPGADPAPAPSTPAPTRSAEPEPAPGTSTPAPTRATSEPATGAPAPTLTPGSEPAPASEPEPTPTPAADPPAAPKSAPPAGSPARPRWWGPDPRPKISGYGGPALRLSGLHGGFAAIVGLEGGVNILQRLTIGASLLWLLNPVDARAYTVGTATRINLNYGGLVVDVAYARGKRVAGTLGGLLGGGGACLQDPNKGDCADRIGFFVGEPRAGLRVVLAPIVRLHLAFGWRLVAARPWEGPRALGGPAGAVTLEFGWF